MSYGHFRQWSDQPISCQPWISVVIPTYNEKRRIVPTIAAIAAHLCETGRPWEMVVSDDGSTDDTVELVRSLGMANLTILAPGHNLGKGHAVRAGVAASRGGLVLFTDADLSPPIGELDRLVDAVRDGADIAIGSRAAPGAEVRARSLLRRQMSTTLRGLVKGVTGLGVRDTQCGFKLFTRDVADELFDLQTLDGFSFDLELLYLAERSALRIAEVPVKWIDAPGSKVRAGRESLRFLRDLAGIRLNDLRGRYAYPSNEGHWGVFT